MKATLVYFVLFFVCTLTNAQYNKDNLKLEAYTPAARYKYKSLQLYPIRANHVFESSHKDVGNYTTLKDAMLKRKIAVTEQGNGTVNSLFIQNVSSDTIMILAGEVVQGGKQDRMIAEDFILYPNSGKKDISVFCVEHGRWAPKQSGSSFTGYFTISSNEVRKAGVVSKSQQDVWNKVAENTEKNSARTSTGTLTALNNSDSFTSELKQYSDFFNKTIISEKDIIGVVAVSGDVILGCDMFATHNMFERHYLSLIQSYATEAITSGKAVTVSYDKVNDYLQSIIADETQQEEKIKDNGVLLKDGKRKIHISSF